VGGDAHAWPDANPRLDYLVDAEPDVAKHLRALLPVKLREVTDCQVRVAHRETPLWEGIRLLVQHGSPIPVVEERIRKLVGLLADGAVGHQAASTDHDRGGVVRRTEGACRS
jgi:CBS-domain-containing membrane protein